MTFLGLPDINAALSSGALDIANSGEPLITIAVQQGIAARWKPMADLYPEMPYSNLLFGPNLLEKDRDAGQRLIRVICAESATAKTPFRKARIAMPSSACSADH